jgi:hypothetical protein
MLPSWNASPDKLLSFGIVWPEPDQAIEALDDRDDDPVVREGGIELTPAPDSP